jgi:hypothetical protein
LASALYFRYSARLLPLLPRRDVGVDRGDHRLSPAWWSEAQLATIATITATKYRVTNNCNAMAERAIASGGDVPSPKVVVVDTL